MENYKQLSFDTNTNHNQVIENKKEDKEPYHCQNCVYAHELRDMGDSAEQYHHCQGQDSECQCICRSIKS